MMFSCGLVACYLFLANWFYQYLFSLTLISGGGPLIYMVSAISLGFFVYYCAIYESRTRYNFNECIRHIFFMHLACFSALTLLKIFFIFPFYPIALVGLALIAALNVSYGFASSKDQKNLSLGGQLVSVLVVALLSLGYVSMCELGFGIVIGLDLNLGLFVLACALIWSGLNHMGLDHLTVWQQTMVGMFIFVCASLVVCVNQFSLPALLLYAIPAVGYYCLTSCLESSYSIKLGDRQQSHDPVSKKLFADGDDLPFENDPSDSGAYQTNQNSNGLTGFNPWSI